MKKILKNPKCIFFIILGGVVIVVGIIIFSHPMFRTSKSVMKDILKLTPMGTHIDDVAKLVKNKTILEGVSSRTPYVNYERGYANPYFGEIPGWPTSEISGYSIIGHKSVSVIYDAHPNIWVSFGLYWGFNEEGDLIDILVDKNWDMIGLGHVRRTVDD